MTRRMYLYLPSPCPVRKVRARESGGEWRGGEGRRERGKKREERTQKSQI